MYRVVGDVPVGGVEIGGAACQVTSPNICPTSSTFCSTVYNHTTRHHTAIWAPTTRWKPEILP